MRVLVRVDVRESDAFGLEQRNLSGGLGFDLGRPDAPCKQPLQKRSQRGLKAACPCINKRGNLSGRQHGIAIHQNHVAAHPQRWRRTGHLDSLLSRRRPCHQGGAGQRSRSMQLQNGAVDPGSQPEVIRVDNEAAHRLSVSTQPAPSGSNGTNLAVSRRAAMISEGVIALPPRVGG